jgi:hypothetical protein
VDDENSVQRRKQRPPEIEREISERYKLEWYEKGLDWNGTPDDVSEVVRRIYDDVIFTCPLETWDSVTPFTGLIWKLGARRVAYAEHESYYLSVLLNCRAPDEETAGKFYEHTRAYLAAYFDPRPPARLPLWHEKMRPYSGANALGAIGRNELKIRLKLQFWEMGSGLSALIKYLEDHGFTDIEYRFHGGREWDKDLIDSIWKWVEKAVKSD